MTIHCALNYLMIMVIWNQEKTYRLGEFWSSVVLAGNFRRRDKPDNHFTVSHFMLCVFMTRLVVARVRPLNPKNTKPEKSEVKHKNGRGSGGLNSKSWGQRSPILFLVYSYCMYRTASVLRYQVDHCLSLSTDGNQPLGNPETLHL